MYTFMDIYYLVPPRVVPLLDRVALLQGFNAAWLEASALSEAGQQLSHDLQMLPSPSKTTVQGSKSLQYLETLYGPKR